MRQAIAELVRPTVASRGFLADSPFKRTGRLVILALVLLWIAVDVAVLLAGEDDHVTTGQHAYTALLYVSFALVAWRPSAAALALLAGVPAAIGVGSAGIALMVIAVAAGIVVSRCSPSMSRLYLSGFFVWFVVIAALHEEMRTVGNIVGFSGILALSTSIGLMTRRAQRRERELEAAVAEQDRVMAEVLRTERERIADELHDVIARDLTIIAMHARVLERTDDTERRTASQHAIAERARQALMDVRRVLHLVKGSEGVESQADVETVRSFSRVLDEARRDLDRLGVEVRVEVDVAAVAALPTTIDTALARIVQEAVGNVIRHAAGAGRVTIWLVAGAETVTLTVMDEMVADSSAGRGPAAGGREAGGEAPDLPPGGYGLARLRERVGVLDGTFHAGPQGGGWQLVAELPRS